MEQRELQTLRQEAQASAAATNSELDLRVVPEWPHLEKGTKVPPISDVARCLGDPGAGSQKITSHSGGPASGPLL